jgi:hypothetical protein
MTEQMVSIGRCAEISGLRSHEMVVGVSPTAKHEQLLARYRSGEAGSQEGARAALVADIRAAVAQGAARRAADLLVALRRLLALREPASARGASPARRGRHCGARTRSRHPRIAACAERRRASTAAATGRADNVLSFEDFRRARQGTAPSA